MVSEAVQPDPETPNIARIYDYYLGGAFNLPVDRERADRIKSRCGECST